MSNQNSILQNRKNASVAGVVYLCVYVFIFTCVKATGPFVLLDARFYVCYAAFRALVSWWAYDLAGEQGKNQWSIAGWCFVFPSLTLIYLGHSKYMPMSR